MKDRILRERSEIADMTSFDETITDQWFEAPRTPERAFPGMPPPPEGFSLLGRMVIVMLFFALIAAGSACVAMLA